MAGINNSDEPSTAPQADRWYNLTLGSSFKDPNSSKFCTLRYEFKPASIDKNQRGTLHKSKDNKVTVEFQNIQPGKPKMTFEGSSEDYKDNDAVLFFDGESFRLERLHRAVKRLRHNRMRGDSTGVVSASAGLSDASPPPVVKGIKNQPSNKETFAPLPVEVERIDIGDFKSSDAMPKHQNSVEYPEVQLNPSNPSPDLKNDDQEEEQLDIMNDDDDGGNGNAGTIEVKEFDFDINIPQQTDSDDEIADVVSDGEVEKGPSAAEALKAQVSAQGKDEEDGKEDDGGTSSSSASSASESSGSGSGSGSASSSSDSESSDGDSVTSI